MKALISIASLRTIEIRRGFVGEIAQESPKLFKIADVS